MCLALRPETETAADVQFDSTHMMNYNAMLSGLRDLVDNPTPRVPVLLCLDTSGSMVGDPIRELNLGVQQFLTEMKGDDLTRCSAETAVVAFNDSASCVADFGTADKLLVPEMEAEGMTCMGEGLSLALDLLEKRKAKYKATGVDYYQPILVVMSDGLPNGNRRAWDEPGMDLDALQALSAEPWPEDTL